MTKIIHRILYFLDRDCRATFTKIAKQLKTSEQRVSYSVKSMQKKKEITGFTTVFDYAKFDLNGYMVAFKINYKKKEESVKLLNSLKDLPEVVWLQTMEGKFDVFTMFLSSNPSYFNKTLKKFISEHKELIKDNVICTVIVTHKYGKQYLHPWMKKEFDKIIGGDREKVKLTETETLVCKELFKNPVVKIKYISKATGLTFKTITSKIKELMKKKVIRRFEVIMNANKLKIIKKKIMIRYTNYDEETENNLTNFCKIHKNIISSTKTFGKWDLIINFESLKEDELDTFIHDLRVGFEEIIDDIDVMTVTSTRKELYLPSNYFEQNI